MWNDPWFDFILAGVLDFIPLMRYAYNWVPARPFAFVGYVMFAYLFSWTDAHWYATIFLFFVKPNI